jgi:sporulation protein YlmC with PRC-barrel domain
MTEARMDDYARWIGRAVIDRGAHKIGRVDDIYADDDTGQPEWLAVHTGWFGTHVSFVPLRGSRAAGDDVMVAYDKDVVKDAPRATPDGHLSVAEEDELYPYDGMGAADWSTTRNAVAGDRTAGQPYDTTTGIGGRSDLAGDAARGDERYDTAGDTTATAESAGTTADALRWSRQEQVTARGHDDGRARLRRWGQPR